MNHSDYYGRIYLNHVLRLDDDLGTWVHRETNQVVEVVSNENALFIVKVRGGFWVVDPIHFERLYLNHRRILKAQPYGLDISYVMTLYNRIGHKQR